MNLVNTYEKMRELKNDNVISFSRVLADLNLKGIKFNER